MKKNIAIIMGGYSSEVEISLKSGAVVHKNISKEVYNTYQVHILKNKWVLVDDFKNEHPINKHDFSADINLPESSTNTQPTGPSVGKLFISWVSGLTS